MWIVRRVAHCLRFWSRPPSHWSSSACPCITGRVDVAVGEPVAGAEGAAYMLDEEELDDDDELEELEELDEAPADPPAAAAGVSSSSSSSSIGSSIS